MLFTELTFGCSLQKYIDLAVSLENLSPDVPLYKVTEGNEPSFFTVYFSWDSAKATVCVSKMGNVFSLLPRFQLFDYTLLHSTLLLKVNKCKFTLLITANTFCFSTLFLLPKLHNVHSHSDHQEAKFVEFLKLIILSELSDNLIFEMKIL